MLADEIIRNKIKDEVYNAANKKVRNIFYVCSSNDGRSVYAIVGNNNKIFGCALVSANLSVEVII